MESGVFFFVAQVTYTPPIHRLWGLHQSAKQGIRPAQVGKS